MTDIGEVLQLWAIEQEACVSADEPCGRDDCAVCLFEAGRAAGA